MTVYNTIRVMHGTLTAQPPLYRACYINKYHNNTLYLAWSRIIQPNKHHNPTLYHAWSSIVEPNTTLLYTGPGRE